jgi:hypothetical protein
MRLPFAASRIAATPAGSVAVARMGSAPDQRAPSAGSRIVTAGPEKSPHGPVSRSPSAT